jgi:hypothetical protein
MILIHPPVVKPCEPPPGIARLLGALNRHEIRCRVLDANLEGILSLMRNPQTSFDRWTERAYRNLERDLDSLKRIDIYKRPDSYKRAVMDLNRVLQMSAIDSGSRLSLSNHQHQSLSPVRSKDLIQAAATPEGNPFYSYFSKRLPGILESEQPSVVGFSLNFLSQALTTFSMLGFLRREYPKLTLVVGGGLITSWVRRPEWKNPFSGLIDHIIDGPGEEPLLSILGEGLSEAGHYTPDYESLPMDSYLSPGPTLPYSSSTGCYWNRCAFCPEKAEGNPYVPLPIKSVVEDLTYLAQSIKPSLLHLLDNALSPALLRALCTSPPGVPWYGFTRITHHLTDPDFCEALRRSGCVMLKLGIESGDQEVIDREEKGIDLNVVSCALKALRKAGIGTYVYLLFGTPSETLNEARKTLEFTVEHCEEIDFLNLAIFNMPVFAPEAGSFETHMHYEGDLSLYTGFKHPKGWDRAHVRQFLDKEFKRHSAIAPILHHDPPFFTSNHAPFMLRNFVQK